MHPKNTTDTPRANRATTKGGRAIRPHAYQHARDVRATLDAWRAADRIAARGVRA